PKVIFNISKTSKINIRFNNNEPVKSLGSIVVNTLFSNITFYLLLTNTSFLYYLKDIDKLGVYFNNINNLLVKRDVIVFIIRK
ncbi:uncharacterized protein BDZ83DRAFT_596055, partial [Colletotrichum acutatum]